MKHSATLTSVAIHGAIGLLLVFVVKAPSSGAITRFFTVFDDEQPAEKKKAKPPEKKKTPEPKKPPERKKPKQKKKLSAKRRRRVGKKSAREPTGKASAPVHDFGLLVDGNGAAPGNAIVVDAAAGGGAGKGRGSSAGSTNEREDKATRDDTPKKHGAARCRGPTLPAKPITREPIDYPMQSRLSGVQGKLVLALHIDARGRVRRVEVVRPVDPQLDKHVCSSVRSWRFTPGRRCGKAVPTTYTISLRFELSDA